jgi:predicted TPR repeat methyltransferase
MTPITAKSSTHPAQDSAAAGGGPSAPAAHVRRGHELFQAGRCHEALAAYDEARDLAEAWLGRARTLKHLQRLDEAVIAYRQALAKGGDAEVIQFSLASLGAAPAPVAAPKRLISSAYDQHSDHYDSHMIGTLKYRIPDFLFDELAHHVPSQALDILDLGCGTGLMGARLRPLARTLTGVDLSRQMLEIARRRQIYDNLARGELIEFLQTQDKKFDLVVAADVFVYFGDLSSVFHVVRAALRGGGLFGFSIEASEEQEFVLRPNLRYAHSRTHIRRLARDHGFVLQTIEPSVLRQEGGVDATGYLAVLRRP